MSRQRNVWPTERVPHLWMHQTQDSARNPTGNLYFTGDTIYSYGSHFPIARICTNPRGERVVLYTTRGYSMTTSKHLRMVHRALVGSPLRVPEVARPFGGDTPEAQARNLASLVDDVRSLLERAGRARINRPYLMRNAQQRAADARRFAAFFDLPAPVLPDMTDESAKALSEASRAVAAERARMERERIARREAERAEELRAWLAGYQHCQRDGRTIIVQAPSWHSDTFLRVCPGKCDEVETSRGAAFPVEHAKRLWPVLLRYREVGGMYTAITAPRHLHLGHFRVDFFDGATGELRAGCHTLKWSEIERFAGVLGLVVPAHKAA